MIFSGKDSNLSTTFLTDFVLRMYEWRRKELLENQIWLGDAIEYSSNDSILDVLPCALLLTFYILISPKHPIM